MCKIGILTFHKSINYGSVLQTWALNNVLSEYNTYIINYEPRVYSSSYGLFSLKTGLKYNIKNFLNCIAIQRQIKFFSDFRKANLQQTDSYNAFDISPDILNKFDVIITGSDQIWNVHAIDCDDIYFLPYKLNAAKIAYACSVNDTDFSEPRCDEKLRNYILNYDFISIREKSGADKVSGFINNQKKVYTMLDPTLLNTKENFEKITSKRIIQEDYIFLYNVWSGFGAVEAAKDISKLTGLPIYTIMTNSSIKQILKIKKAGVTVETKHTSPGDFLSLIRYSNLVITDSFHGTAFSLIFEKKFVCLNSRDSVGKLKNDERIVNVLKNVGLENRYISRENIATFDFKENIDYKTITKKRMEMANYCKAILKGAIEGNITS